MSRAPIRVFRSVLEATVYADGLRSAGDTRPMQVVPMSNGQAALKYQEPDGMETNELINELRDWAIVQGPGSLAAVLNEAADRLEALDERVSIMEEGCAGEPGNLA